ncbi:phenylacetic acid degradation protein PaaD [Amylibacter marinus]|uniref:Phenylacetic acid degradation protein PaaD n=1 Tax=Amylibacter marinus TaxID=1475483 RepID=A0ABQ5VUR8_9RHOB|nr:hydroxyphenylacetyl-CoA thioesterase PaaI [Amylibacter marinus]GLQ35146.1 phenylacetic acid degradation protein PaaD [Amylibacter marinus]
MTPQERADKSAEAMWAADGASKFIGISLDSVAPGKAIGHITVEKHHVNGLDICHGGTIFHLADTIFAFACNSYNTRVVAQQCSINFMAAGMLGDTLTATAQEVLAQGRSGIYDVTVANQNGDIVALFRGNSRQIRGTNFPEDGI